MIAGQVPERYPLAPNDDVSVGDVARLLFVQLSADDPDGGERNAEQNSGGTIIRTQHQVAREFERGDGGQAGDYGEQRIL